MKCLPSPRFSIASRGNYVRHNSFRSMDSFLIMAHGAINPGTLISHVNCSLHVCLRRLSLPLSPAYLGGLLHLTAFENETNFTQSQAIVSANDVWTLLKVNIWNVKCTPPFHVSQYATGLYNLCVYPRGSNLDQGHDAACMLVMPERVKPRYSMPHWFSLHNDHLHDHIRPCRKCAEDSRPVPSHVIFAHCRGGHLY